MKKLLIISLALATAAVVTVVIVKKIEKDIGPFELVDLSDPKAWEGGRMAV